MRGRLRLVSRLVVKDLRHRPAQALLLLLAIAAATATLTLGLSLRGTTDNPYARTRAATNGPDVVATVSPGGSNAPAPAAIAKPGGGAAGSDQADAASLVPLEHDAGVVAFSGPFPVTWTSLRHGQSIGGAEVEGRSSAPSTVDQPKLLHGSWVSPGGVVVEAGFASAFGLGVGDRLVLGGSTVRVVGTAVSAAIPSYPDVCSQAEGCFIVGKVSSANPGLVWAATADLERIAGSTAPVGYFLNLKLHDPAQASGFANRYDTNAAPNAPYLLSWQSIRDGDAQVLAKVRAVLVAGSSLLALLAIASVVVLVGGRMAEQTRRVGLLKAVGGTPWFVAALLLVEHVLVGVCAAGVGLLVGWLVAPLIDGPGAGLLGAPSVPALRGSTVALVVAVAVSVAIVATIGPATRAAGQSTVGALEDSVRSPRRRATVIRLSAHLPAALLLGVRLAVRRPWRLLLNVFSVAVTTSGLVAVLIFHSTTAAWSPGPQVIQATRLISVMLVVLAAVNAAFIAWTTAIEARHPAAVARSLGATPRQIVAGLCVAQLLPALVGALLGIPAGVTVYEAPRSGPGATTLPSVGSLLATVVLILIVIAVLTAAATRIGARRPVADALMTTG